MTNEPDKVDLESVDLGAEARASFEALFPGVIADGVLDTDRLKNMLGVDAAPPSDGRERYGLMWAGKAEAVRSLQTPSRGTLAPDLARSVDWGTAQNVFIEGDNLEVLKLLQKAYNDKVKLIYIDPPYNTGKDFVYTDDFRDGLTGYLEYTGQLDREGRRISTSTDAVGGRRHGKWLSMMYPRLVLARNLLTQDGVLFVSIDDNEVATLRLLLDEIFGPENFIETYIWESTFRPDNSSAVERENAQYVLAYARSRPRLGRFVGTQKKSEGLPSLTMTKMAVSTITLQPEWVDFGLPDGEYGPGNMGAGYSLEDKVVIEGGVAQASFRLSGRIKWSQSYVESQAAAGTRFLIKGESFVPYSKKLQTAALPPTSLLPRDEVGDVLAGNAELRALFGEVPFDFPKPTSLLKYLVNAVTHDDPGAIVLDFFAGSGSTAHAVALLNEADGGRRRVVSINLQEPTGEKSVARKSGYEAITDVTYARLRRVMDSVTSAQDQGLRVLRLDESNFVHWEPQSSDLALLPTTIASPNPDDDSIAQEVLLKEGVEVDAFWTETVVGGARAVVAGGVAVVLSRDVTPEVVAGAFATSARVVVFLEDGFAGHDAVKTNATANAKQLGIKMKTV